MKTVLTLFFLLALRRAQCVKRSANITYVDDYCQCTTNIRVSWDFIVVGAGTAGTIIARRLAENPAWNILLLEAGGDPPAKWSVPVSSYDHQTALAYEWPFKNAPSPEVCQGFVNGSFSFRSAKVVGGCGSSNAMFYIRGSRAVYDEWGRNNPGWSYKDVLPLFKKSENFIAYPIESKQTSHSVSSEYHSRGGRITIDTFPIDPKTRELNEGLKEAYESLGYQENIDPNGEDPTGYGELQGRGGDQSIVSVGLSIVFDSAKNAVFTAKMVNIHVASPPLTQGTTNGGFRSTSANEFLLDSPNNLKVCKFSLVDKVLMDGTRKSAKGVSFIRKGRNFQVSASKEVILSAGVFGTVTILERSGIGRKDVLSKIGVPVIQELQGVGENLIDHFTSVGHLYAVDNTMKFPGNPLSGGLIQTFIDTVANGSVPDVVITHFPTSGSILGSMFDVSQENVDVLNEKAGSRDLLNFGCMVLSPRSRGHVHSTSKDPNSTPHIFINGLAEEDDKQKMLTALRIADKIMDTDSMKKFNPEFVDIPQCTKGGVEPKSEEYYRCLMKTLMASIYHPVGTCKMGPSTDKFAVVDHNLRVHGIRNLRIWDGSIMPTISRGNTLAPIFMIGEKAAELIRRTYQSTA